MFFFIQALSAVWSWHPLTKGKLSPDCNIKCKSDILSSLYLFGRHLAIDSLPCYWEFNEKIPYQMFVTSSPIHQARQISNSLFNCMGFICAIYIGLSCCSMTRFEKKYNRMLQISASAHRMSIQRPLYNRIKFI